MTRNIGSGASHDAAWLRLYAAVAALPLVLTACGGGGGGGSPTPSPPPSSATITVTPSNTAITAPGGGAVTLTAAVTGSTASPTWTLSGPGTLSASSGTTITYTPPTTTAFDTSTPVIVSASVAGVTKTTTLTLTTTAAGLTWANVTATSIGTLQSVDYFNSHYVAVSDAGNALVSSDAATWTAESALASNTASDHFSAYAVGHLGSTLVAVGSRSPSPYTTNTGAAAYSTDGLTWTQATLTNVNAPIRGLIVSDHLVGVGDGGNFYTSTNGHSWNLVATITGGITYNGGTFASPGGTATYIAVGDSGYIAGSYDGIQWTASPVVANVNLRAIAWTGSKFVAVGDNGTIITSPDGFVWDHNPASAITGTLRSVAVSSTGEVVVVGDSGIESSPDGLTWHARDPAGAAALFDVSYLNSQFIAVGAASAIKTSTH